MDNGTPPKTGKCYCGCGGDTGATGNTMWKEIKHKDDMSNEERKLSVEEVKNAPPISPMYAFLHPFLLVRAHKLLMRYQGRTWFWPRLSWFLMLGFFGYQLVSYFSNQAKDPTPEEALFSLLVGIYVLLPISILLSHFISTIVFRLGETCVWCHIIQKNCDGSIKATLLILVYKLPFLDDRRENPAPWQKAWWNTTNPAVILETKKDVSQLNYADIYDESVCRVRPPTSLPPSAKRYMVEKVDRNGDISIKERRRLTFRLESPFQTLTIPIVSIAISAIITILVDKLL